MFARIGGEEFVLLMPDTSSDVALTLNNELRETFMKCKFSYEDTTFSATSSVGIADFTENDTPESVLKKADLALYQSKDTGRNRCTIFKAKED
jgi:diguanylate cyclase